MTYGANPPSVSRTAFECPHCGAYTCQSWFHAYAYPLEANSTPSFPTKEMRDHVSKNRELPESDRTDLLQWIDEIWTGRVFLGSGETRCKQQINNLFLSKCFACTKISVWRHDVVLWPPVRTGPVAHRDMPENILSDFEEARSILELSPRGAAALLRLSIQKLCNELGQEGKTIDQAIGSLVEAGLNPVVADALDSVRVIGNEAVHPGTMDLRDDRETAEKLFTLVNIIVERMVADPRQVQALYETLPASKRGAIERRKAKGQERV